MPISFRRAASADTPRLKEIWSDCFGGVPEEAERFFGVFGPECGVVGEAGGTIAAAAYIIPTDGLAMEGETKSCSYIYALGVHSAFRGRGFGAELTRAALRFSRADGFRYACLRPSDEGLFEFYGALGFARFFTERRQTVEPPALPCEFSGLPVSEAGPERYKALRERALRDTPHIVTSLDMLRFQRLCGPLLEFENGCAAVELCGGMAYVKELLGETPLSPAASTIAFAFSAGECLVTQPAPEGLPCGMVFPPVEGGGAFLGPAFD